MKELVKIVRDPRSGRLGCVVHESRECSFGDVVFDDGTWEYFLGPKPEAAPYNIREKAAGFFSGLVPLGEAPWTVPSPHEPGRQIDPDIQAKIVTQAILAITHFKEETTCH